jgi:SOS-response transcriptional repressor LexA
MSEHTISDNLQRLLKLHGDLSLSELARGTQIPQPTLHHIIEGKTKKPRRQALEALARFFSISIPQLTGITPLTPKIPDAIKESLKISTVPLIDWCLARHWEREKDNLSNFDQIILGREIDKNSFALQLQDSRMEPLFQENSILIFDPSKAVKERDFVLVYLYRTDLVTLNRLFIDNNHFYIKQEMKNGDAELIKLNLSNDKIIATLVEARLVF